MQHQSPQRGIIRIRQRINDGVQTVPPNESIRNPRRINKIVIMRGRQQRIGQFPEELLEQVRRIIDVVMEDFWVAEIDASSICVEEGFELLHLCRVAGNAIYSFVVEAEEFDSLDTLVYDKWDGRLVADEEFF
jgi:hypothetical protein